MNVAAFLKPLILLSLALAARCLADDLVFDSTSHRVSLLELYTSEGCSSCPPAEAWLSSLKENPRLWKDYVPVAFHVDYWDNLGWPDRFASKVFTERQRELSASWGSGTVYTPGFVLNAKEWHAAEPPFPAQQTGILKATLRRETELTVHFTPEAAAKRWEAHVAVLGFDLQSDVRAGENTGRKLRHDFVALSLTSQPLQPGTDDALIKLPSPPPGEKALAIWVTEAGALIPVQATGGWVK